MTERPKGPDQPGQGNGQGGQLGNFLSRHNQPGNLSSGDASGSEAGGLKPPMPSITQFIGKGLSTEDAFKRWEQAVASWRENKPFVIPGEATEGPGPGEAQIAPDPRSALLPAWLSEWRRGQRKALGTDTDADRTQIDPDPRLGDLEQWRREEDRRRGQGS